MLKQLAAKSFIDGLSQCNEFGKRLVENLHADSMLDVGSGDGALTMEFARVVGAKQVHAVEYQDEMHPLLEQKGIKWSKFDVNCRWEYADNSFDFVLSSQNIEHVDRSRHYVQECFRVCKPSGHALIMTENLAS